MTKTVEPKDLTEEQKQAMLQTGDCPFCKSKMQELDPASNHKARELYCELCHWSYPIGRM